MGNLVRTVDAADRLRLDLDALSDEAGVRLNVGCSPLREDFDRMLPFAWIRMLGGDRHGIVVDSATLSVDVYAATWKQAMDAALDAHMLTARLPYDQDALTDWKAVSALSLPYENPDPDHPSIPRCSFSLTAVVKADIR